MLPSKSFGSLKGMLPKIHHPLPLNEKSTKKLLDTLMTSFRKNLDREHGWLDEDADGHRVPRRRQQQHQQQHHPQPHAPPPGGAGRAGAITPTAAATASSPSPQLPASASAPAAHRPTDHHLRAILSNPLFSYDQAVSRPAARLGSGGGGGGERDPMAIFDWAVARGIMTPKRALGCLLATKREAVQSSHVSQKAAMSASGAGRRVVQWLRASGLERDLAFLAHAHLTAVLVQFLAADEALEEIVWLWIERLRRGEGPAYIGEATAATAATAADATHHVASASFLLDKLVRAKMLDAATLDDAYGAMNRGAGLFDRASPAFEDNIFWPWCALSWKSTFTSFASLNMATATPRLYEAFVGIMDHDDRPSIRLERAHLDLRHPTRPTPAPAVALLADDHLLRHVQASTPAAEPPPGRRPGYPSRIVSMGLDTVRHLAFVGESGEAQRIFNRLRDQFGAHLDQLQAHT